MKDFVITAKNNPKIKELRALVASSRERRERGLFVTDGVRLCREAADSGFELTAAFCTEACREKNPGDISRIYKACGSFYTVSAEVMKSVSDTVSPQGIICVVKMRQAELSFERGGLYIVLDTVQNPDNLGAVARTAEALGLDGLAVIGGCDIYNPKALRASMGALFRIKVRTLKSLLDIAAECMEKGLPLLAAVPDGNAEDITKTDFSRGGVCVIGNEGNGVSRGTIDICDKCVTIKMRGRAESLNAAAAASIIMWEMTAQAENG